MFCITAGTDGWHQALTPCCQAVVFYHQHLFTSFFFLSSGPQLFVGPLQHEHSITFTAGVMPLVLQHQEPDLQLTNQPPGSCPFFSPFFYMQIPTAGVPRSQVVPALIAGVMDLPTASVAVKGTPMGLQDTHMIPCPLLGSHWLWALWLMSRLHAGLLKTEPDLTQRG